MSGCSREGFAAQVRVVSWGMSQSSSVDLGPVGCALGAHSPTLVSAVQFALCGFRGGNARLSVPGGDSSRIPPMYQMDLAIPASDSSVFLWALCSITTEKGTASCLCSHTFPVPMLYLHFVLLFTSSHLLQGPNDNPAVDCWHQKVPEITGTGRSSCGVSFLLCCVGICSLQFSIEGLGKCSWKNSISSRHLQLLRWGQVATGCWRSHMFFLLHPGSIAWRKVLARRSGTLEMSHGETSLWWVILPYFPPWWHRRGANVGKQSF